MADFPPEVPAPVVVDAFLAVGALNQYLHTNHLIESTEAPNSEHCSYPVDIFSVFIEDWMQSSLVCLPLHTMHL